MSYLRQAAQRREPFSDLVKRLRETASKGVGEAMLTDDEIYTMYSEPSSDAEMVAFARAVEAAVLAKLAAAEMPRPDRNAWPNGFHDLYNEAQLREYGAACAAQQLSAEPMAWKYTSKLAGNQWFLTSYQSDLSTYKADKVIPLFTRSTT